MAAGPQIVVFGEVLFDRFGDEAVLGGAPFNVAWNLAALGLSPLLISAVGDDDEGRRVREAMAAHEMDAAGLQTDPLHPTGEVVVTIEDDEPHYDIRADSAWDFIDTAGALATCAGGIDLLYHGSLALRSQWSREALVVLRDRVQPPAFIDVNLRDPWWEVAVVREAMDRAAWAKLNRDELARLGDGGSDEEAARRLIAAHGLEAAIVTLGGDGAFVVSADGGEYRVAAPPVDGFVDAVGAGDAFSAVTIAGLIEGLDWETILANAAAFAARVCTLRGALSMDPGFYEGSRRSLS